MRISLMPLPPSLAFRIALAAISQSLVTRSCGVVVVPGWSTGWLTISQAAIKAAFESVQIVLCLDQRWKCSSASCSSSGSSGTGCFLLALYTNTEQDKQDRKEGSVLLWYGRYAKQTVLEPIYASVLATEVTGPVLIGLFQHHVEEEEAAATTVLRQERRPIDVLLASRRPVPALLNPSST